MRRCLLICGVLAASCADSGSDDAGDGTTTDDAGSTDTGHAQLPSRPQTRTCRFEGHPPGLLPQLELKPAFGDLAFDAPVAFAAAPGRPNVAWVAEAGGRVLRFATDEPDSDTTPQPMVAIDLQLDPEATLDAIAFAPDFETSGHVFVRTHDDALPPRTTVSRVTLDTDDVMVPDQTRVVLQVSFGADARHGGGLVFGHDGTLFVALGDGGTEGELVDAAGDPSTRPGSVLRIDPSTLDTTGTYAVPDDNPLAGTTDGAAAEAWAWGLRDPRHCAVDALDGALWCGDVGELEQEVGLVPAGGDLGWPLLEGKRCRGSQVACELTDSVAPRASYDHTEGDCQVVAGTVYRGAAYPELDGAFVYADACSGRVRALRLRADGSVEHNELLARVDGTPAAFGVDADGELYLLDGDTGRIWRVAVIEAPAPFPTQLSASSCFADLAALEPAPDLVPYEVNAPLWTDDAIKHRHIALPPGASIGVSPDGQLQFPTGTYLLKTFVLERIAGDPSSRKPVETRVMIRREHAWEFHSYRWNDEATEATLLDDGFDATFSMQGSDGDYELRYFYPNRFECRTCHGSAPSNTLGPRIDQLDRTVATAEGTYAQLDELERIGMFTDPVPAVAPITAPDDADASLEARARAYLHGNCGHCHRPGGWTPPELDMDLRWSTSLAETRTCNVQPQYDNPWADGSHRITPGDPDDSMIWQRIQLRDLGQMPPLGTTVVDPASDVVGEWIRSLEGCL